ncbi:SRPBCC family protein [Paraburkholderia sp. JHI869]|uniref:SRPBCC family protein n=1 Tax=Paraburkholderia sp. JHI869 TaxID=3112959 RepID=UPI00316B5F52
MANVSVSIEIGAPVEQVWAMLGDFNGLPAWLEFVRSSRLSDGGRIRHLEAMGGAIIVEELLEHSEHDMFYRYTIVEGPDPVSDYVATLSAQQIDAGKTAVTWASRFEPREAQQATSLVEHYEVLYRAGLDRLKTLTEARARA